MPAIEPLIVELLLGFFLVATGRISSRLFVTSWERWGFSLVTRRSIKAAEDERHELRLQVVRLELSRDEMKETLAALLASTPDHRSCGPHPKPQKTSDRRDA
jgi:hypothetical protein